MLLKKRSQPLSLTYIAKAALPIAGQAKTWHCTAGCASGGSWRSSRSVQSTATAPPREWPATSFLVWKSRSCSPLLHHLQVSWHAPSKRNVCSAGGPIIPQGHKNRLCRGLRLQRGKSRLKQSGACDGGGQLTRQHKATLLSAGLLVHSFYRDFPRSQQEASVCSWHCLHAQPGQGSLTGHLMLAKCLQHPCKLCSRQHQIDCSCWGGGEGSWHISTV